MGRPKSKGAYVPLAAQYFMDDAILEAGTSAELLFVRCLSFLASVPTDGYITDRQVKTIVGIGLRGVNGSLNRLMEVGLLEAVEGGYVARSWLKWNRSAQQMDKLLAKDRERKRGPLEQNDDGSSTSARHKDDVARHDLDISPQDDDATADTFVSEVPHDSGESDRNSERNPDGFQLDSEHQSRAVQSSTEQNSPNGESSSDADASDAFSEDVIRLSNLLAELVRGNGHKVETVGVTWWRACDRLLRLDQYSVEQVEWMIRWATADEFWLANIQSMPTLRKRFSQMKAQAVAQSRKQSRPAAFDRAADVVRIYQEEERREEVGNGRAVGVGGSRG